MLAIIITIVVPELKVPHDASLAALWPLWPLSPRSWMEHWRTP